MIIVRFLGRNHYKYCLSVLVILGLIFNCKNDTNNTVSVIPISHGTLILESNDVVIYVDPVGGSEIFVDQKSPSIIVVTDIHGDHLNIETLEGVIKGHTKLIVPIEVAAKLPDSLKSAALILSNYESKEFTIGSNSINIEAIPMYNLREEAKEFHTKGRGNGYVITMAKQRIYISGDTEDTPEMRKLENIDIAFVCMNLPWTMSTDSAAAAVIEFQPKAVYPYHYKGTDGFSDIEKFKKLVNEENALIDVRLLNWYPNR